MLIQRKDVAVLPGVPSSDTVDIEIVALGIYATAGRRRTAAHRTS